MAISRGIQALRDAALGVKTIQEYHRSPE
jgi:hypothetical protein